MSKPKDDGGPAFPVVGAAGAQEDFGGMTLRDYFAAKAMAAIQVRVTSEFLNLNNLAESAYIIADAMLAERNKC